MFGILSPTFRAILKKLGCGGKATDTVMGHLQFKKIQNRYVPPKQDEVKIYCPLCRVFSTNMPKKITDHYPVATGEVTEPQCIWPLWSMDYFYWFPHDLELTVPVKGKIRYIFGRMKNHLERDHLLTADSPDYPYVMKSWLYFKGKGLEMKCQMTMEDHMALSDDAIEISDSSPVEGSDE